MGSIHRDLIFFIHPIQNTKIVVGVKCQNGGLTNSTDKKCDGTFWSLLGKFQPKLLVFKMQRAECNDKHASRILAKCKMTWWGFVLIFLQVFLYTQKGRFFSLSVLDLPLRHSHKSVILGRLGKPGFRFLEQVGQSPQIFRVWEAVIAAVANCIVRACSVLTLFVLWSMRLGYLGALGACLYWTVALRAMPGRERKKWLLTSMLTAYLTLYATLVYLGKGTEYPR